MSSSYPGSLDSLTTTHVDDGTEIVHATTVNDLADAANKIEVELGTNPRGSAADVKTRIANTETVANAAIPKSTVTAAGDIIYATGSAAVTRLATSAGQFLKAGASAPAWATPAAADLSGYPSDGTKFLAGDGTWKAPTASKVITGLIAAAGTITAGTGFTINGSHVTGIYTITFSVAFGATPTIQVTLASDPASVLQRPGISAQSASAFTVKMANNAGALGDAAFNFLAYQIA